jgi:prepilin-type N-terminal cleavage/methylation domain-containing protein/prepilin-type processing-associated H-X9-DG protein
MKHRDRSGFTHIELLIVVAIIVLLVAILCPVFAQAREKARQTGCMSNLKQIAAAMQLYSDDHDLLFPPVMVHSSGAAPVFPMTWMCRLQPYVRSTAVFIDPSSGHTNGDWRTSGDLLQNYSYTPSERAAGREAQLVWAAPFGVAMWEGLGGFSGDPIGDFRREVPSWSQTQVARPAETIIVCDHQVFDWGLMARALYYPAPRHLREPDLQLPNGGTAPEGRINAAFVDGHVRSLKHEQFWEILPAYTRRGTPTSDVFRYFWPYE